MIGPITKMIPTWNTRSASSRAVEIWDAKRSCSSSSLTTPSLFVSAAPSAENWSSSSCQVGIRMGHSFLSERSERSLTSSSRSLRSSGHSSARSSYWRVASGATSRTTSTVTPTTAT